MRNARNAYLYEAVAVFNGRPAGFVCYGRTRGEAARRGRASTTMTIKIVRVTASREWAAIVRASLAEREEIGG